MVTRARKTPSGEDGFIIIEVLVSALILAIVAGAVLTLITASTRGAAVQRDRSVASDLAQAESLLEAARADADAVRRELAEQRTGLEAQLAALRQQQDDHRTQMRRHLAEQLSLLDRVMPEPPAAITG